MGGDLSSPPRHPSASEKPKVRLTLDENLLERTEGFQLVNRIPTNSEACQNFLLRGAHKISSDTKNLFSHSIEQYISTLKSIL